MKNFSISLSIKEAFKGFAKWWVVLCSISLGILASQSWIPKYILHHSLETKMLQQYYNSFKVFEKDIINPSLMHDALGNLQYNLWSISVENGNIQEFRLFLIKVVIGFLIFFLILCLLYTFTIVFSKASVSKTKDSSEIKRSLKKSHTLALSYLVLSVVKVLPFCIAIAVPFLFLLYSLFLPTESSLIVVILEWFICLLFILSMSILGVYIYIRLYFTGFIITEKSADPFKAIRKSWTLSKGVLWKIFIIFLFLLIVDLIAIITIIGFIPLNSIKYTLRASIYRQLLESSV